MTKSLGIKDLRLNFDRLKRGLPLLKMTLSSFYYDKKIRVLCIIVILPLLGSIFIRWTQVPRSKADILDLFEPLLLFVFLNLFVVWFSLVIGTSIIADEKENETLVHLLVRPISRVEIIFHKFMAYIIAMTVFYSIPVFSTYVVLFSYNSSWMFAHFYVVVGYSGLIILGSIAFGSIFLLIGVLFKRPLIIGLLIAVFWNYLPLLMGAGAEQLTLSYHLEVLFDKITYTTASEGGLISMLFIGGLILLCVGTSMFSFRKQELL